MLEITQWMSDNHHLFRVNWPPWYIGPTQVFALFFPATSGSSQLFTAAQPPWGLLLLSQELSCIHCLGGRVLSPLLAAKERKVPAKGHSVSFPILQGQGTQKTPRTMPAAPWSQSCMVDAPAAQRTQCLVSSPGLES